MEVSLMAIKVVTDSTSYIPLELRNRYDISVVSLGVNFGSENYDEEDIDNETFYDKLKKYKELPKSSQPAPLGLYNLFEELVSQGHSVVGIFLSSEMSGTYSNAMIAKEMILKRYPNATIEIIDSRSNCMELGFPVIAAAKAAHEGKLFEQILSIANDIISKSRFLFVPQTLEYLQKGGRIGGAAAFLGSILKIKPILTVVDGKTAVFGKVRTLSRAVTTIIDTFLKDAKEKGLGEVVVHHINCMAEGMKLAERIEESLKISVPVYPIGPVIGLHVGPGALGVAYYTKN